MSDDSSEMFLHASENHSGSGIDLPIQNLDLSRLLNNVNKLLDEAPDKEEEFLRVQSANKWIEESRSKPVPKMLFSEFWYEGELCILFADTNLGKSILAVQIGDSISRCKQINGFKLEANQRPVIYFDFEQSAKQFQARYSIDYLQDYRFSETFYRAEINPDSVISDINKTFEEYMHEAIEQALEKTGAKILIIDNITYLKTETERAKDALPLMKELKALKKKYDLSILALAHTPKRDSSKPITRNDLQGSKMLINFCDSAFAIGEGNEDEGIRYLKQIKQRNTQQIYGSENICVCQITKPHNFLGFEFIKCEAESVHLRVQTDEQKETIVNAILERHKIGESLRTIGMALGISHMKVKRILAKNNIV